MYHQGFITQSLKVVDRRLVLTKNRVEGCGIESNVVDRHVEEDVGMSSFDDPICYTVQWRE